MHIVLSAIFSPVLFDSPHTSLAGMLRNPRNFVTSLLHPYLRVTAVLGDLPGWKLIDSIAFVVYTILHQFDQDGQERDELAHASCQVSIAPGYCSPNWRRIA